MPEQPITGGRGTFIPVVEDFKNNSDVPWIEVSGVIHFDISAIGYIYQALYRALMHQKGYSYNRAVDYVYDNSTLSTWKISGLEVFIIENDLGFHSMIVQWLTGFSRLPGYYTPPGGGPVL